VKILVVDDSRTVRASITQTLAKMGHSAVEAADGAAALDVYRREPVSLVLLDVSMPVMDGYETARALRSARHDEWIPIIFLSAHEGDQNLQRAIESGGDDYLVKPVSFVVLSAKIRAMQRIDEMRQRLVAVSRDLAAANRELERLSRLDGLTGLANRRHFDAYLSQEMARARRTCDPVGLLLCDVDHFKAFNDRYGHQAGDDCLRQVAAAIASCCGRALDLAARYGGEELALILPSTPLSGLDKVAQDVVHAVGALQLPHLGSTTAPHVTVSVGGYALVPGPDTMPEDLISPADQALYRAKRLGRNRAIVQQVAEPNNALALLRRPAAVD
jgi:diguanylate cyclase (GGDEF)-like protein